MSMQPTSSDILTHELPRQPPLQTSSDHQTASPRWVVPVVIAALVVGLAGLGFGAYAVAATPDKTSGPQGPAGPQGVRGPVGPVGPQGVQGVAGPAGTIADTLVVSSTALTTAVNPPAGTTLVAQTSCPSGHLLMSGGAEVSGSAGKPDRDVELRSSFPLDKSRWETVAMVTHALGTGGTMTMKPFVVCGIPAT